tara:strand:- start:84 stop:395 length:312 start_codon:yes stop_codon:yes gene_type:complete
MKKSILTLTIFVLIIVTTITKHSTKELEDKIISAKANISFLEEKLELILLDYNFLTTPQKLKEYQIRYFEKDLVPIDINKIQQIKKKNDDLVISEFIKKDKSD